MSYRTNSFSRIFFSGLFVVVFFLTGQVEQKGAGTTEISRITAQPAQWETGNASVPDAVVPAASGIIRYIPPASIRLNFLCFHG